MPQMAPMNWLMLFMYFISMFLLMNSLNYFMFLYNPQNKLIKKYNIKINWKW
uniref:ATP synthase complex subunit 8 n=1 Tax=Hydraena gracilis TaxID=290660 RepID=A0A7D6W9Q5_9COLE|nr:ATP synthase F0 subunit 8 [Hydraena gracilis]